MKWTTNCQLWGRFIFLLTKIKNKTCSTSVLPKYMIMIYHAVWRTWPSTPSNDKIFGCRPRSGFSAESLGLYFLKRYGGPWSNFITQIVLIDVHLYRQILTSIEIHIWEMPSSLVKGLFVSVIAPLQNEWLNYVCSVLMQTMVMIRSDKWKIIILLWARSHFWYMFL